MNDEIIVDAETTPNKSKYFLDVDSSDFYFDGQSMFPKSKVLPGEQELSLMIKNMGIHMCHERLKLINIPM